MNNKTNEIDSIGPIPPGYVMVSFYDKLDSTCKYWDFCSKKWLYPTYKEQNSGKAIFIKKIPEDYPVLPVGFEYCHHNDRPNCEDEDFEYLYWSGKSWERTHNDGKTEYLYCSFIYCKKPKQTMINKTVGEIPAGYVLAEYSDKIDHTFKLWHNSINKWMDYHGYFHGNIKEFFQDEFMKSRFACFIKPIPKDYPVLPKGYEYCHPEDVINANDPKTNYKYFKNGCWVDTVNNGGETNVYSQIKEDGFEPLIYCKGPKTQYGPIPDGYELAADDDIIDTSFLYCNIHCNPSYWEKITYPSQRMVKDYRDYVKYIKPIKSPEITQLNNQIKELKALVEDYRKNLAKTHDDLFKIVEILKDYVK